MTFHKNVGFISRIHLEESPQRVRKQFGRWLSKLPSIAFKADKWGFVFLLPVEPSSSSSRLLPGRRSNIKRLSPLFCINGGGNLCHSLIFLVQICNNNKFPKTSSSAFFKLVLMHESLPAFSTSKKSKLFCCIIPKSTEKSLDWRLATWMCEISDFESKWSRAVPRWIGGTNVAEAARLFFPDITTRGKCLRLRGGKKKKIYTIWRFSVHLVLASPWI